MLLIGSSSVTSNTAVDSNMNVDNVNAEQQQQEDNQAHATAKTVDQPPSAPAVGKKGKYIGVILFSRAE